MSFLAFVVDSHPNNPSVHLPPSWAVLDWHLLLNDDDDDSNPLAAVIRDFRRNQLPRSTITTDLGQLQIPTRSQGVSPSKLAQIYPFAHRLKSLFPDCKNIVDVGAGKAHLTRILHAHNLLALDQTHYDDGLPRQTIRLDTHSLITSVDRWAATLHQDRAPVVLVALHACGSLTLDTLRVFLQPPPPHFHPVGAVLVGCCYNLLRSGDFPLSQDRHYPEYPLLDELPHPLPVSAYHMACQIPHLWHTHMSKAELAVQKVVWRAILARLLPSDIDNTLVRLGKLPKHAYDSYASFLRVCADKLNIDVQFFINASNQIRLAMGEHLDPLQQVQPPQKLANQLAVLHVLRCLAGPVIETAIVLDRHRWIKDLLKDNWDVQLVNIFDQSEASPRNIAIVVKPKCTV